MLLLKMQGGSGLTKALAEGRQIGAVKRMKQGRGGEARKSSLRRFHMSREGMSPEACGEQYLCRRNGQFKGSVDGSVQFLGRQLGKGTERRNGLCRIICFSLYLHCHLKDAHPCGIQNQYYQCQWLRVFKPWVPFLCIPVIGGHSSPG